MAAIKEVQEQVVLQLFDLYWFKHHILTNPPPVEPESPNPKPNCKKPSKKIRKKRSRRSCDVSKSLVMLEFEELKGFMDLGFEFSEEDQRSPRLASVIPGLRRLEERRVVSRERSEEIPPLLVMMNKDWKIPSLRNQDDVKNHLRVWARAVASAVR